MTATLDDSGSVAALTDTISGYVHPGLTKRELYAGLAMLAQIITDTVPGPACDALLAAATAAGQPPAFRLALTSVELADMLVQALDLDPDDVRRMVAAGAGHG